MQATFLVRVKVTGANGVGPRRVKLATEGEVLVVVVAMVLLTVEAATSATLTATTAIKIASPSLRLQGRNYEDGSTRCKTPEHYSTAWSVKSHNSSAGAYACRVGK